MNRGHEEPAPDVRFTTSILIAIYAVLLALSLVASFRVAPFDVHGGFDNFSKVAGALIAAVSALMAAVVTIVNFDRSTREARNLARLNGDIAQKLADYKAALDRELLQDKVSADFKFERLKTALSKEIDGYMELMNAANAAYYLLAKLESGKWAGTDKDKLDEVMEKASGKAAVAMEADAELWTRLWNRANFIAESAERKGPKEQPILWRAQAGELSGLIQEFQRVLAEKLHHSD